MGIGFHPCLLLVFFFMLSCALEEGSRENDRIQRLPGQSPVNVSQYGGYVTVDKVAGRALYYYFVEAEHPNKESLPLILWLNGGPGCSSLGYGAMEELGPFRVHSDGKTLYENTYAWHKVANVLFLESPAGVGFSYTNTTSDYDKLEKSGDDATAADNYAFLVNWLDRYPEYKGRDFYICGESYAGHYVPQLAHTILQNNKNAGSTIIHLKGILVGNAEIDDEADTRGMYDYFGSHALTSAEIIDDVHKLCDFSRNLSNECIAALDKAFKARDGIDIYNIYGPLCRDGNLTSIPKTVSLMNFDPCSDYYVSAYLNRPDVQKAMHANVTKVASAWDFCNSTMFDKWQYNNSTILPILKELMSNGLRVWIYSGDTDGRVPVTSTEYSIKKMNLTVKTEWHPWFQEEEVAGYAQVYNGDLTFATVRAAGHDVPSFKPDKSLTLIKHFLTGTPLTNSSKST